MGTGGATALLSPDPSGACAGRVWCVIRDSLQRYIGPLPIHVSRFTIHVFSSKNNRFSDIYIQEVFTTSGFVLLII
jgi:hypothetical protein